MSQHPRVRSRNVAEAVASLLSRGTRKTIVREMPELRASRAGAAKVPVPAPNQDREELAPRTGEASQFRPMDGGALGTGIALCPTGRRPCQSSPAVVHREEAIAASRDVGAARSRSEQPSGVPMSVSEDPTQGGGTGGRRDEDPTGATGHGETAYDDPTQGGEIGATPEEDPAQGSELGAEPNEDPSESGEIGADPTAPSS